MSGAGSPSGSGPTRGLRLRKLNEETREPEPAVGRAEALKRRCARLASVAWSHVRPTRNRSTGYVAVGAVGALVGTSVVVGVGAAGTLPHLADIGAWLGSSKKGEVAHANGLTGAVDGKITLPGMTGDPLQVSQDGRTVLVLDSATGKVVRIDPSQLTAEQSADYGASGLQLVSGGSFSYLVDPVKGTAQRIDPVRTTPIGTPISFGGRLGTTAVDPQGTLWVPLPGSGEVVPVVNGQKSPAVSVGKPGDTLDLTLANGQPVVTDVSDAVMKVLSTTGVQASYNLQGGIGSSSPASILVPAQTDGTKVPVLATDSGSLAVVDVAAGQQENARIPVQGQRLAAPQSLGQKVYIPDESTGGLLVYDTAATVFDPSIRVTGVPGTLQVFVHGHLLWANDENNAAAAVVDANGVAQHIGKYATSVPTARKPNERPTVPSAPPAPPQPAPTPSAPAPPTPLPTRTHRAPAPPKPATPPAPMAPGTPQVQSGNGSITVTFAAASGMTPKNYTLQGVPSGATVTPNSIGPSGPFVFQVNGGSCSATYSFTVVAHYAGGAGDKSSQPSAAVRPCVAPSTPTAPRAAVPQGGHGATVSWSGSGKGMTYSVSWPGGSATTTSTSHKITGLTNSRTYTFTVTATNAAGTASAGGTINLTPPPQRMNIAHNMDDKNGLAIRTQPSTTAGGRAGTIPGMTAPAVTVYCKTTGTSETHPYEHITSNVWGKISSSYGSGYVADIYLDSRYNANVWQCT